MKENLKNQLPLIIVLIASFVVYIPVIVFYPSFILDDFLIYKLIALNPQQPICTNPTEEFFLFLRPVSYFTFWLDFHLFGQNYYFIKSVNLLLHLIVIGLVYKILTKIILVFHLEKNNRIISILLLFFSFHPDVHQWIFWIANRTELLGILFYFLSIYLFVEYFSNEKGYYLIASFFCFILSILSKQIGLHLPLLFFYFLYLNHKYQTIRIKTNSKLILFIISGLIIMVITVLINTTFVTNEALFFQNLWKKPFSLVGNLFFIFLPLFSQKIYNFFLFQKPFTIFIFITLVTILFLFRKRISLRFLIEIFLFYLIVSFPRMTSAASTRINTIYLLWIVLFLYFILTKIKEKKIIYLLAIFFFIGSFLRIINVQANLNKENDLIKTLNKFILTNNAKHIYIAGYPEPILINEAYYYYLHNKFGSANNITLSPVNFSYSLFEQGLLIPKKEYIYLTRDLTNIKAVSKDPLIHFYINDNSTEEKIVDTKMAFSGRGYSEVTYELPKWLDLKKTKLIYFDGKNWHTLN